MLTGTLEGSDTMVADDAVIELAGHYGGTGDCTIALRPERLNLGPADEAGPGSMRGTVTMASYLGPVREHLVRVGPDTSVVVRDTTARAGHLLPAGSAVTVRWDAGAERLFGADDAPMTTLQPTLSARITDHV